LAECEARELPSNGEGFFLKDGEERRKRKKARFFRCNRSTEESVTPCTSMDMNLV